MKLYFAPGACSLAPHLVLLQLGLPFSTERVSLRTKLTKDGADYRSVNPKGQLPALVLDDGTVLTENAAVLQYIADQAPESGLAPALGSFARYRLMEWLSYLSTEVHKRFSPMFSPAVTAEIREAAWTSLAAPLTYLAGKVDGEHYLMGEQFTVADAYLFAILNWIGFAKFTMNDWPTLQAYHSRVAALPAVQEAMRREGLA
ncbi:glutathione transferase GstA [Massilia sp. ST3]|uniref:glutathione transferase GstA n=1 Tax=Massilia sp. ST3 TaxID=2824903 RepID=UPI001B83C517|nr:glutathione transferase GstA [Massilia sp. ST3]MBQ5950362.1 glutathione transferase GstA [Massilia sp. ST3]